MNNSKYVVILMIFVFAGLVFAQSEDAMKATFDKSTKIWAEGEIDLVDEVYTSDAVRHGADGQDIVGAEALKGYISQVRTIYPDFNVVLQGQFGSGNMLASHWTVTGTNTGALGENMPATGKAVEISGVTIAKFKDGKIAEEWAYWNHGGEGAVMTQLGFTLAPPMMAEKE